MCWRGRLPGKPRFVSVWELHKHDVAIIKQTEETVPTHYCEPAVWVTGTTLTDWRAVVAFRQSLPQQAAMQTHMHTHTLTVGAVGVWEGEASEVLVPDGQWARACGASTSPDKDKAGGVREQWHVVCDGSPQLLICLSLMWLCWLCHEWRLCQLWVCRWMCTVCNCAHALTCDSILHHSLICWTFCVSMNGCASVVYVVTALSLSSSLHSFSVSDIQGKLKIFFKASSDLLHCNDRSLVGIIILFLSVLSSKIFLRKYSVKVQVHNRFLQLFNSDMSVRINTFKTLLDKKITSNYTVISSLYLKTVRKPIASVNLSIVNSKSLVRLTIKCQFWLLKLVSYVN